MEHIEEEAGIGVAVSEDFEDTFTPLPFPILKSSLKRSADRTNRDARESLSLNPASSSFAPSASMWDNESRLGMVVNGSMAAAKSIAQFPRSYLQCIFFLRIIVRAKLISII